MKNASEMLQGRQEVPLFFVVSCETKSGKHHFRTFPHVAETFMLAVGNSELKYSIISMYFSVVSFDVPFNISLNKVIIAFSDQGMSTLSVHEVCKGYGGMVVPTPHPEPPVHFENISINIMNIPI